MFDDLSPRRLSWAEVDPRRHRFDRGSAADVVNASGPGRGVPSRPADSIMDPAVNAWLDHVAAPWADAMSHVLVEQYGRWALGWRWARGEGDVDGGPIRSWCCPSHSMTDPDTTRANVAAGFASGVTGSRIWPGGPRPSRWTPTPSRTSGTCGDAPPGP